MKLCVLASGSKGNCTFVQAGSLNLLIDAGTNCRYITQKLNEIGIKIEMINYVIISHLHDDHVSALRLILAKSKATLLITPKMLAKCKIAQDYDLVQVYDTEVILTDMKIIALKSSHDSPDSRNFIFEFKGKSIAYITDTGYVKAKYFDLLKNRHIYLMESNHDLEMLTNGPYPDWLKNRILSDYGHLSNQASSFYLTKLIGPDTKKVVLMHLSEVNNSEAKTLETLKAVLAEYDISFNQIEISHQNEKSKLFEF